jgi:DNA-binding response OmpR family regulator
MKILVVEDEIEILNFIRKSLESECFAVDTAEDGEKGSQLARSNDYDLILLDNIMPKKSGLEVCQDVRKAEKTVPILVLSVRSETTSKVDMFNAGADDYLTKPFSLDELMARIKALLRRPKKINGKDLFIDDLKIDMDRHFVERKGKEIYLTRKEFALLAYLIQNKGIVLSRNMIMEHVWDTNVDQFSNTIESHIMSLRKKIDFNGVDNKLIQTIPGRGYKLGN